MDTQRLNSREGLASATVDICTDPQGALHWRLEGPAAEPAVYDISTNHIKHDIIIDQSKSAY